MEGMTSVATIGLDIAKSVFQVHGIDAAGQVVFSSAPHTRARLGVFRKAGAMSRWDRGLQHFGLFGAGTHRTRVPGHDAGPIRQAPM